MELYSKTIGAVLIALVLLLSIPKEQKHISMLLGMVVCAMVLLAAYSYLEPVIEFLNQLQILGQLDESMLKVLLKAVGIGFLTEISALLCADSGSGSLGKGIQILGGTVILWISIPLFQSLLVLIQRIMEDI